MKTDTTMKRINTRITPEQQMFIKKLAKVMKRTEGEIVRTAINMYIKSVNDEISKK